jgi:hypothetical protein
MCELIISSIRGFSKKNVLDYTKINFQIEERKVIECSRLEGVDFHTCIIISSTTET